MRVEIIEGSYASGEIESRVSLIDGKRNGLCETWHKSGELASSSFFIDGLANGTREWWYVNGDKKIKAEYALGKIHGEAIWWYPNGTTQSHIIFINDNPVHNLLKNPLDDVELFELQLLHGIKL